MGVGPFRPYGTETGGGGHRRWNRLFQYWFPSIRSVPKLASLQLRASSSGQTKARFVSRPEKETFMNTLTSILSPLLATSLISWSLLACGSAEDTTAISPRDLQGGPFGSSPERPLALHEAERSATEIIPGEVVASRSRERRGLDVYEVRVRTAEGTVVAVYIVTETGAVLGIEQEHPGPAPAFRLAPGYISLVDAIRAALAVQPGEVVRWELELEDGHRWQYEIYVLDATGMLHEVEVDAVSGAILEVKREDEIGGVGSATSATTSAGLDAARQAALTFVAGRVTKVERELEHGHPVWKVEIRTQSGGTVELRLLDPSLALTRAEGEDGPFDYDLDPGSAYLSLQEALSATGARSPLEEWRLDRDGGRLVWELRFAGGDPERAEIDALTGQRRR